jgi:hypothetical protein
MDTHELQATDAEHAKRVADWRKWRAVYDGTNAIIAGKCFKQHERESDDNYARRCEEALSWGISQAIVDLFAQYLFLHPIERFLADCDYLGNGMDVRLREDPKWAAPLFQLPHRTDALYTTPSAHACSATQPATRPG